MYIYGLLILLSMHMINAEASALINAIKNICPALALDLIQHHKGNIDCVDEMGNSALHYAVSYHLNEVTNQLLKHGAQPNARNKQGEAPIHIAVRVHSCHALQTLIDYHADINIQDMLGNTPMHIAIQLSHTSPNRRIIKRLLTHSPSPDLSIQNNDHASVILLLESKNSNALNSNHKRRENKNIRHAKLLVANHQQACKQKTQADQSPVHSA